MGLTTIIIFISILHHTLSDQDGAKAAADFLLEAVDHTANPCDDFYQYSCGNWEKNTGGQFAGVPQQSTKMVIDRLIHAIKSVRDNDPGTPEYQQRLKIFFTQCVSAPKDYDKLLLSVYKATHKEIQAPMPMLYPKKKVKNWNRYFVIGKMQHFLNTKVLFDANVQLIFDKCSNVPMLSLSPALGEGKPLLHVDEKFPKRLVDLAAALGSKLNERDVAARIEQLKELEKEMNSIVDNVDAYDTATVRLKDLSKQINAGIDWRMYFSGLFEGDQKGRWEKLDPKVHFNKPVDYFKKVDQFINNMKIEDLLDYAYLRMFNTSMNHYVITPKLLQRDAKKLDDEQRCLEYVLKHASAAAARLLFEGVGSMNGTLSHWKYDVDLLAEAVFAAFRYMIHTAEWVPNDDKASIINKLNAIPFFSGIPDWILDDYSMDRNTPPSNPDQTVFDNIIYMYRRKFEWSIEPLYKDATQLQSEVDAVYGDKTLIKEPEPDFEWGAFFYPDLKKVDVTLGLTLPPMYNISYPLALKFGVLGWIIGHEMLHAFDKNNVEMRVQSRQLTPPTLEEFRKRVNCINKQYSGYCFKEECYCVSGSKTLNDNIADMEGLKMAYMAYKFTKQMGGNQDEILPGLENITPDQLFFLSAARIWCGTSKEAQIYKGSGDDVHAPGRARIELSMMNFPAFAQAFNCPAGSKFAPLQTCELWGYFLEPNIQAPNGTDKQGQTDKDENC